MHYPDREKFGREASFGERIADLRAASAYAARTWPGRPVIAAGHSFGTLSALCLGGGLASLGDFRDPTVKAVLGFSSPGRIPGLIGSDAYAGNRVPTMVVTGDHRRQHRFPACPCAGRPKGGEQARHDARHGDRNMYPALSIGRTWRRLAIAALALCLSPAAGAQPAPTFDPTSWKRDIAGPPTRVLVLASTHLKNLPDFKAEWMSALLDRLAAYRPDIVTIEALAGQQCDQLRRYPTIYPGVAGQYCRPVDDARAATGERRRFRSPVRCPMHGRLRRPPSGRRRLPP